jgi:hypothetical protein
VAAKLWNRFTFSSRRREWFDPNWSAFYNFVRHCHDRRVKLAAADVMYLAENEGVAQKGAEELAKVYEHCRRALATRYRIPLNEDGFRG